MWLIGVAKEDIMAMGQLLGIKLAASEFVAYTQLADLKDPTNALHLVHQKSVIMAFFTCFVVLPILQALESK